VAAGQTKFTVLKLRSAGCKWLAGLSSKAHDVISRMKYLKH